MYCNILTAAGFDHLRAAGAAAPAAPVGVAGHAAGRVVPAPIGCRPVAAVVLSCHQRPAAAAGMLGAPDLALLPSPFPAADHLVRAVAALEGRTWQYAVSGHQWTRQVPQDM